MRTKELKTRNERGVTLIALVVTIIVLLILAGVTLAALSGNNGILQNATKAKEEIEQSSDIEKIRLATTEAQIGENAYQELDATNFQEALNNQFEGRNLQLSDNGDGSFTISLDNGNKMYYANSDGQIINNENMLAIDTAEELKAFRDDVNSGNTYEGWYVYLANDITLDSSEEWDPIGKYDASSSNPYDNINKPFMGIFDGQNHKINGINIDSLKRANGLFQLVRRATIKNLGIGEGNISGSASTGGIVGYGYDNSKIINCYNNANITSTSYYSGGIVGYAKDNVIIENCYNAGTIIGSFGIGGICGEMINSEIKNCYNIGNLSSTYSGGGSTYLGGIVSQIKSNSKVENCYNIGNINTNNEYAVGGIVGGSEESEIIINTFFLENTINGGNGVIKDGTEHKNADEMKQIYSVLGSEFKEDNNSINNGYPILSWQ